MGGGQVTHTAPVSAWLVQATAPAPAAPAAAASTQKDFEFVQPLATIEDFEPMAGPVKEKPGIVEISGSQATVTVKWDPAKTDEATVRKYLADAGHPVK